MRDVGEQLPARAVGRGKSGGARLQIFRHAVEGRASALTSSPPFSFARTSVLRVPTAALGVAHLTIAEHPSVTSESIGDAFL